MNNYKFTLQNAIDSIDWLKAQLASLKQTQQKIVENTSKKPEVFEVGRMYLFHYDPKHKKTLKYYDAFPLILLTNIKSKGSFSGINLHYLPLEIRLKLLSNLSTNLSVYNKEGKLEMLHLSYDILNSNSLYKAFEPCFKNYISNHVASMIKEIHPEDWGYVCALPLENFQKQSKQIVWNDSIRLIN